MLPWRRFQFHQLGGKVGAARGLGSQGAGASTQGKPKAPPTVSAKATGKPLSKAETEAIARREAARARVEKRTLSQFGL
eukprot:scaffold252109_cov34-Prasinocladus_malaysianus.AAC.1